MTLSSTEHSLFRLKLPFRQKVVEKGSDFEEFVVIWMVMQSVGLVIVQMEEGQD